MHRVYTINATAQVKKINKSFKIPVPYGKKWKEGYLFQGNSLREKDLPHPRPKDPVVGESPPREKITHFHPKRKNQHLREIIPYK